MKLHVLGCHGPFPPAGGATSGYLLEKDGNALLMDCGSGVMGRLTRLCDPAALEAFRLMGEVLAEILAPILPQYGVKVLYLGGQVSKSFVLFEAPLRAGLAGVSTLERIEAVEETDLVHMIGATAWYLRSAGKRGAES